MNCIQNSKYFRKLLKLGRFSFPHRCERTQLGIQGCRYLLSDSYLCTEEWKSRLTSPALQNVGDYMNFTLALREQIDQTGKASPIDIDILANKVTEIEAGQTEYVTELLRKFRKTADGLSVLESTPYAIVRGFIELGKIEELYEMLTDKHGYGLFPDAFSTCILLDHCIKAGDYQDAAKMAYELMLQEDFSHSLSRLLSLYACVHHAKDFLPQPLVAEEAETAQDTQEEEEEDWIPVKWIRKPYYDDHFDIQSEQFLLGKTLAMIGRTQSDLIGRSCQLVGLGLYEKFNAGLDLLEKFISQSESVTMEAILKFQSALENAPTRDLDAPEKELGFQAIADEIELLKCTPEEKTAFQTRFKELSDRLAKNGLAEDACLTDLVASYVKGEVQNYELTDIDQQKALFKQWTEEREGLLKSQVDAIVKEMKIKEVVEKLKELQHKEEMLKYFEKEDEISMALWRAPKEIPKPTDADEDPDVLKAKRIARRKVRTNVQP